MHTVTLRNHAGASQDVAAPLFIGSSSGGWTAAARPAGHGRCRRAGFLGAARTAEARGHEARGREAALTGWGGSTLAPVVIWTRAS